MFDIRDRSGAVRLDAAVRAGAHEEFPVGHTACERNPSDSDPVSDDRAGLKDVICPGIAGSFKLIAIF